MFKRFKKNIASEKFNERWAKCYLFNKARALHQSAAAPSSPAPELNKAELNDALVVVSRPPPEVRLVIFKEMAETGERPIIFDSKSLQKIEIPLITCSVNLGDCCGNPQNPMRQEPKEKYEYKYARTPSDWDVLSEMLFGSVGMAQKVASLKIHYIKRSQSVMLSRVFFLPSKENATASLDRGIENHFEMQRANSVLSRRKANTMPVPFSPSTPTSSVASSFSSQSGIFHRSDSGISLSSLLSTSYHSGLGSFGAVAMKMSTSSAHGRAQSLPKNPRESFTLSDETSSDKFQSALRRSRMKIGFAVICEPEDSNATTFQEFFFHHFPVIESHMTSIKEDIEKAFQMRPKTNFIDLMMKAVEAFSSKLQVVYSTPRLPEPVWSTLTPPLSVPEHNKIVVKTFISDLTRLVGDYNTKQKNHFFGGLLTAVLTYHLGWVASASPSPCVNHEYDENAYNALWAQLGDLYGAVGSPTKVCRTVVTGNCHELVSTFLSVLSYFIRSSAIEEVLTVPEKLSPSSLGVLEPPADRAVTLTMIPSEQEETEDFVLVSYTDDEGEPPATTVPEDVPKPCVTADDPSPVKAPVSRSRSSPFSSDAENPTSSLSRSQSGPIIKKNRRERSYAFLGNDINIRHRTFSNNVLSKERAVRSRRKSNDAADVAKPSNSYPRSSFSKISRHFSSNTGTCGINTEGSFCMKTSVDMNWPQAPVHQYGASLPTKDNESAVKTAPNSSPYDKTDNVCKVIPSFVDRIQPKVENVLHVQCARPRPPVCAGGLKIDSFLEPESNHLSEANPKPWPRSRLTNGPDEDVVHMPKTVPSESFITPDFDVNQGQVCSQKPPSNAHARVKLGTRRRQLPISPEAPSAPSCSAETGGNEANQKPPNQFAPRFRLARIPSVEINHNAFDEYFDRDANDLPYKDGLPELPEKSQRTNLLSNHTVLPHNVTSCPDFTENRTCLERPNFLNVGHRATRSDSSESMVPRIYPSLSPFGTTPPPVPTTRRRSSDQKKICPPLPLKPPVGVVTFNVDNEQVSFLPKENRKPEVKSKPTETAEPKHPSPERQWSVLSSVTLKPESEHAVGPDLVELPLAEVKTSETKNTTDHETGATATGFASLMADYNQEYLNDFILHGTPNQPDMRQKILSDLGRMVKNPNLDEPIAEAICIVADTDSWSVKVYSSQRLHSERPSLPALTSKLVCGILHRVSTMYKMKMSADFCMTHLESELRQLVLKSRMLAEYARGHKRVTMAQLSAALSIESQDLPLLMAIASCHSPHVAPIML